METPGGASSRRTRDSTSGAEPRNWTSPAPVRRSPNSPSRLSTRSRIACASSDTGDSVVKEAHSGFCPASSVFRYAMKYRGILSPASRLREELHEPPEQIVRVVRPGGRLGMVLHREDRQAPVAQAFARAVVEVDVCDLEPGGRPRVGSH